VTQVYAERDLALAVKVASESVEVVQVRQRWLSYEQASAYCALDPRTLRRLAAEGEIRVSRPRNGKTLVDLLSLDALLERKVVTPATAG
jgi:hypothetical protein